MPQPVTASYQDENGQTLKPDVTHTGEIGAAYQIEALEIPGYELVKTNGNASGVFTKEPQTVVYVYKELAVHPVTVSYQDADGKSLHADVVLSGAFGQNYQTEQLTIPGYVFSKVMGSTTGTFGTTAQHVIYVYTPEPSVPETPVPQQNPGFQPSPARNPSHRHNQNRYLNRIRHRKQGQHHHQYRYLNRIWHGKQGRHHYQNRRRFLI
nr:MucBP domain-containing protein [Lactiplantibacillus pentosus]